MVSLYSSRWPRTGYAVDQAALKLRDQLPASSQELGVKAWQQK